MFRQAAAFVRDREMEILVNVIEGTAGYRREEPERRPWPPSNLTMGFRRDASDLVRFNTPDEHPAV